MADLIFGAFLLGLCFYVGRAWIRWFQAKPKLAPPRWRSTVTVFGFSACTVALVTLLLLMTSATVISNLTPHHPVSLIADRAIFATSVFAILAGIVGKGPLETPTFVCSILCLSVLAVSGFAS